MRCSACGADNREGRKFCGACGRPLAFACPECGSANEPGERFCGECGRQLADVVTGYAPPRPGAATERRLVSVLFADLVGFTSVSEQRDAEDVRELLSLYFDRCSRLVGLYGGVVEKFIGDAVMAVWGTPTAQEDDAERAVRAALDLVRAVEGLGETAGAPDLRLRAGVLTGEAAVTIGAEGQGMVAGDLVNTASRIQAIAEPGTVLVGESTRRATEAAIAYEGGGTHELRGKAEPVQLWRALRVTAGRKGALKSTGLEPPFVGRERELRLVKELFHGSAEESTAHLVSVVGIAGIGKSRLAWELFKYVDGLADTIWWHRGRCLSYGEGVTYWALAEMVRMRAEIREGEEPDSARRKLHAAVELHVLDPEERDWIEPRLAHLVGVEEASARERDDLFAAWRLFFERMAERQPLVMVFEDVQWADVSLLEFVDYLLEWSRNHRIFVLTLARPELAERHPSWGAGRRNFTALALEPLSSRAMEELLDGFAPGLPELLRSEILARAEGVPLYAVETVRMLLDRGLLELAGNEYRPTGPIEALDVPETLHALVAARLDSLAPDERRLLQDASVLGKTFTKQALVDLSGHREADLEPLLASLVRKEVLSIQVDPRSPERGQYGFLQDMLRRVAYETLTRTDRKARHLAAATRLEESWGPGELEIAEVVASHLVEAYRLAPDAADAGEIKARAQAMLARAGERAASLAANEEAQRYFEQAAELAEDPLVEARLRERAGEMAWRGLRGGEAQTQLERSLALFEGAGETHPAARVSARLGWVEWRRGHLTRALERMERAFAVLAADEPDEDLAFLAAELGRLHFFKGDEEIAHRRIEQALEVAEALWLPEVISEALNTKGILAGKQGRSEEALALVRHALELALENDLASPAVRAYNNLADLLFRRDRYAEALEYHEGGLALSRRVGMRPSEQHLLSDMSYGLWLLGRWDEALAVAEEVGDAPEGVRNALLLSFAQSLGGIYAERGRLEEARDAVERFSAHEASDEVQARTIYRAAKAALLLAEGRYGEARRAAESALESTRLLESSFQGMKAGYVSALEAALALGDLDEADRLVGRIEALKPGHLPPFLRAQAARFRARMAAARGEQEAVEPRFKLAAGVFREFGLPFWLAVTQLEHGEWLSLQGRASEGEPLLAEAGGVFARLEAAPWLERLARARQPVPA